MGAIVNPTDKIILTDNMLKDLIDQIRDQVVKEISKQEIGNNLKSLKQTTTSTADGGDNIIEATFINEEKPHEQFHIKNGHQGSKGDKGADAHFGNITATVGTNDGSGTPTVTIGQGGTDASKDLTFTFSNIKGPTGSVGPKGDTGKVYVPSVDSNNLLTWTLKDNPSSVPSGVNIKGSQGIQGNPGPAYVPSVNESSGVLSWSKQDNPTSTPSPVNIKGPAGEKGSTGPAGPQGNKGDTGTRGSIWNSGTALTGSGENNTWSSASDAKVGDYYLNTSTGDVYRCTTQGSGTTAKWKYEGSIKGPAAFTLDGDLTYETVTS